MRVRTGQTKVRSFDHGLAQAPLNPRVDPPEADPRPQQDLGCQLKQTPIPGSLLSSGSTISATIKDYHWHDETTLRGSALQLFPPE